MSDARYRAAMVPLDLDHLVFGVPDLEVGVAQFRELTGVEPRKGGRHHDRGTANYLVGLGDRAYLEIIGPDPDASQPPSWFGLNGLTAARLLTWAVRPDRLDECIRQARAAGYDPGEAAAMSRQTSDGQRLSWRLTPDTVTELGGTVPLLIDWGVARHPASTLVAQLSLRAFSVHSPNRRQTTEQLTALGVLVDVNDATAPGLRAVFDTQAGPVELS
ncbi:MAG: VOC family protein [Jatrophihabitans sp.]